MGTKIRQIYLEFHTREKKGYPSMTQDKSFHSKIYKKKQRKSVFIALLSLGFSLYLLLWFMLDHEIMSLELTVIRLSLFSP